MSDPRRNRRFSPVTQRPGERYDTGEDTLDPTGEHGSYPHGTGGNGLELDVQDLEILEDDGDKSVPTMAATPRGVQREMPRPRDPRPLDPSAGDYPFHTQPPAPMDPNSIRVRLDRNDPTAQPFGMHAATEPGEPPLGPRGSGEHAPHYSIDGPGPVSGPRLIIIGGNNRGKMYPLKLGDNSIGRGVDNDIILADIAVSRKHTLICHEQGGFVVRDLGSGNGTLLNGTQIHTHPLIDGDQIELGNTLLRFVLPAGGPAPPAGLAAPAGQVHPSLSQPGSPSLLEPGSPLLEMTQPEMRASIFSIDSRVKRLVVFGGLGLVGFLVVLLVIKALVPDAPQAQSGAPAQDTRSPDEAAAEEYLKGTNQYHARQWEQARMHFLKVLKLAPSFDQAKRYAEQSTKEITSKNSLGRAKNSLAAKDFQTARLELSRIPSTSVYAADARRLKQQIDEEQLTSLLELAKTLKAADDLEGALAKVKEARDIAPTNPEVLRLHAQLTQGGSRPTIGGSGRSTMSRASTRHAVPDHRPPPRRPRGATTAPKQQASTSIRTPGGSKSRQALAYYKDRHWGPAYSAAKELASGLRGHKKRSADELAEAIRLVGQNWNRAGQTTDTATRVKYYRQALTSDKKIKGGYHQQTLKKMIAKTATQHAANALARKRYPEAYKAVKMAKTYGGRDPLLGKIEQSLESSAMQLFTRGYTMRASNLSQARRIWQQVLKMVPPSSPAYQKAYTWLNNSTPRYQDEDED